MQVFVAEISPVVSSDGSTQTFLFSSTPWKTNSTDTPANTPVRALLKNAGTLRRELFSGARVTGAIKPSYGNLVLANPAPTKGDAGVLDAWLDYGISGARIVVRRGTIGTAYPAEWPVVYIAYGHSMVVDLTEITIRQRDRLQLLDQPAAPDAFAGTGGLEGNGGVSKRKQLVMGAPGYVPPQLVDVNKQIYHLSTSGTGGLHDSHITDPGSVLYKVFDNGIEIDRVDNYTSADQLLTVSPGESEVRFWFGDTSTFWPAMRNGGVYFRLGSPPEGDIRVFAYGAPNDDDHARAGSVRANFTASVLALRAGFAASDIQPGSDLIASEMLVDDDRTYLDVLSDAALVSNGWFGMTRLDKFISKHLLDPESDDAYFDITPGVLSGTRPDRTTTSIFEFNESNTKELRREPVSGMDAPVWKVVVTAGQTWPSALANGATALMKDYLTREPAWTAMQGVSTTTLLANPGAISAEVNLRPRAIQNTFAARLFLERYFVLYGGRRDFWTFRSPMNAETLAIDLHDVVTLKTPRFGMSAGVKFRVVGITIDCASKVPSIRFVLWGGERGRYTGGSGGPGSVPIGGGGSTVAAPTIALNAMGDFTQVFYGTTETGGGGSEGDSDAAEARSSMGVFDQVFIGEVENGDEHWGEVIVLLHGEGADASTTFTDSSSYGRTDIAWWGGANVPVISTSQFKYGSASITSNGTGNMRLGIPFGSEANEEEWTIEFWFRRNADGSYPMAVYWTSGNAVILLAGDSYGADSYKWKFDSGGTVTGTGTTALSLNVWYHIAVTRKNSSGSLYDTRLFVNGVKELEVISGGLGPLSNSTVFEIGRANIAGFAGLLGHIDEFRVTAGVCRYDADFTPPTGPYKDF